MSTKPIYGASRLLFGYGIVTAGGAPLWGGQFPFPVAKTADELRCIINCAAECDPDAPYTIAPLYFSEQRSAEVIANLTDTLAVALYKQTISELRRTVRYTELYRATATEQRDASWAEADRLRVELHRGAVLQAALRIEIDELRRQLGRFEKMT